MRDGMLYNDAPEYYSAPLYLTAGEEEWQDVVWIQITITDGNAIICALTYSSKNSRALLQMGFELFKRNCNNKSEYK